MKSTSRNEQGLTLVELMLTTLILSVTLLGMIQLFVYCTFLVELSKEKAIAISLAHGRMEDIFNSDYATVVTTFAPQCACNDGIDNDGDGNTDSADNGCNSNSLEGTLNIDTSEEFECDDGVDNDSDGSSDLSDSDCASTTDDDEGYLPSIINGACRTDSGTPDTLTELRNGERIVYIDGSNIEIKEVQVVVSWDDRRGRAQSITLTSVLSQR